MILTAGPTITFIEITAVYLLLSVMLFSKLIKAENKTETPEIEHKRTFDFQEIIAQNQKYVRMADQCSLRIYGGKQATKGSTPYQVALRKGILRGKQWIVFCGGAIITDKNVVTASHCFDNVRLRQVRIIAGTLTSSVVLRGRSKAERLESLRALQQTETWRKIAFCYGHAQYSRRKITNDLAILEVEIPFIFSTTVQPIPILTHAKEDEIKIPADTSCLVSGFGLMDKRQRSSTLRKVCVPTVPFSTCGRIYSLQSNNTQICAGVRGKDSCQGDSGGPMTCKGVLVGIVSFGAACGEAPGVYTRLAGYTTGKHIRFTYCSSNRLYNNAQALILIIFIIKYV